MLADWRKPVNSFLFRMVSSSHQSNACSHQCNQSVFLQNKPWNWRSASNSPKKCEMNHCWRDPCVYMFHWWLGILGLHNMQSLLPPSFSFRTDLLCNRLFMCKRKPGIWFNIFCEVQQSSTSFVNWQISYFTHSHLE